MNPSMHTLALRLHETRGTNELDAWQCLTERSMVASQLSLLRPGIFLGFNGGNLMGAGRAGRAGRAGTLDGSLLFFFISIDQY